MSARMQIVLGKGSHGISLTVLSRVVEETKSMLHSLGGDIGDSGEWRAKNFRDGSVIFDLERETESDHMEDRWRRGLATVLSRSHEDEEMDVVVSRATRERFERFSASIPENVPLEFGVFNSGNAEPDSFFSVDHREIAYDHHIEAELPRYFGEIQGVVHAFYKESQPRRLVVRERSTDRLVRCEFRDEMYQSAVETLQDKDAVVFVQGEVKENYEGKITHISVSDFELAPEFDSVWMEAHIGAFPDLLSGDKRPAEVVDYFRESE